LKQNVHNVLSAHLVRKDLIVAATEDHQVDIAMEVIETSATTDHLVTMNKELSVQLHQTLKLNPEDQSILTVEKKCI
jgi:hypothetical protein